MAGPKSAVCGIILAVLSLFLSLSMNAVAQERDGNQIIWDTAFEAKLNATQPFDTIFDIAGIKKGMVVGGLVPERAA
jgi:hypothetical protein